jgi:simple sugar transport system permease protein
MAFLSTIPFSLIMALGLTFVIIAGEIDLSFPGIMLLGGFVYSYAYIYTDSPVLAMVLCLLSGAATGYINGVIITKIKIPSIIVTLGTQFIWGGLAIVLSQGKSVEINQVRETVFYRLFVGRIGGAFPAQAAWAIGSAVVLGIILKKHRFGEHVMFAGDNREAARMMGVNVDRTLTLTFVLMGFLTALSSLILTLEFVSWYTTSGPGYLLITIAAVFIGGTSIYGGEGTIFGTVIGAFIVGSMTAGIVASGVGGFWTRLVDGLVLITAVLLNTYLSRRRG